MLRSIVHRLLHTGHSCFIFLIELFDNIIALPLHLVHHISHLPYYAEVLAFFAFGHFLVFGIVGYDVNAVFVSLEAFYEGTAPVVYGVDSVCAVVAEIVIKEVVIVKKCRRH